jgi:hypothetical protein
LFIATNGVAVQRAQGTKMLISAVGWNRNAGKNTILDENIADASFIPKRKANSFEQRSNKLYAYINSEGSFVLTKGPQTLRLSGDYNVTLELSEEDVVMLFKELIKDMNGSDILAMLSEVD